MKSSWMIPCVLLVFAGSPWARGEIVAVDYSGNGCPEGTVGVNHSGKALTLIYDDFLASTDEAKSHRKAHCMVSVTLRLKKKQPKDEPAVLSIQKRGYFSIDPGVRGRIRTSYFFQGQRRGGKKLFDEAVREPYRNDEGDDPTPGSKYYEFALDGEVPLSEGTVQVCGKDHLMQVHLKTHLVVKRFRGDEGDGDGGLDSTDLGQESEAKDPGSLLCKNVKRQAVCTVYAQWHPRSSDKDPVQKTFTKQAKNKDAGQAYKEARQKAIETCAKLENKFEDRLLKCKRKCEVLSLYQPLPP